MGITILDEHDKEEILEHIQDTLIEKESGYNILDPAKFIPNKGLDRNTGSINNNATAFNLYDKLEINGGVTLVIQRAVANKSFNVIFCFYDENETFISSTVFNSGAKEQKWMDLATPVNAEYLSMAYRHLNGTEVIDWTEIMLSISTKPQIYRPYKTIARNMVIDSYEKFERSFDNFNMNKSSLGMFRRVGVLGDSMSVGYLFDKDNNVGSYRNIEYSWVQHLARAYGNTFTNFGNSGIACSGWFTGSEYGNVEVVKDGNKCQAYIIGLGINDSISDTYLVGDTSDIGTDNGTFIANYSKIIESVKTVNADAKIFIMTLPLHSTTRDVKNVAIKKVAEHYKGQNVYLVDLAGEYFDVINKASVKNYASGNHFSAGGYKNLAAINGAVISDVIDNHADDFWNVHLIPYDEVDVPSGGEPDTYVKSATVNGNILTLFNKDDSTVEFSPRSGGASVDAEQMIAYSCKHDMFSYFTNNAVGTTKTYGVFGIILPCKAGDTIYTTFALSTSNITTVQILDNIPSKNNGALSGIIGTLPASTTNQYYIPDDLVETKAVFLPILFSNYPGVSPDIYDNNAGYVAQTQPFDVINSWYKTAQDESFIFDDRKNMTAYASLYSAVSDMVGANVYISGDSITFQSAVDNANYPYSGYGWYSRIARKYMQTFTAKGSEGMMWYPQQTNGASAVKDVKDIIASGIEYDYIILEWGTNDIRVGNVGQVTDEPSDGINTSSVSAIKYCLNALQTALPKAKIIVVMPCIRATNLIPTQDNYYNIIDQVIKSFGVRRVYQSWDSGITLDMMYTDGIHLRKEIDGNQFTNDTEAVARYSKCLEAEMLQA